MLFGEIMRLRGLIFLNSALVCLLGATLTFAQSNRGSIAGTITDPTGGVVANATVTATETNTASTYNTVTSQAGDYNFPQLLVGSYEVTVSAPGFKTEKRTGIVVQINTATALNIQLSLGQTAETVTVVSDVPSVQSPSSEISGVITPRQVQELPL